MDLLKVLLGAIEDLADAKDAADAEAEAKSLAALTAKIEEAHALVALLPDALAKNKAEALKALHDRFKADRGPASADPADDAGHGRNSGG